MSGSDLRPLHEPVRCKAMSKRSGEQCNNPPMNGQAVCRMHGGATQASRNKAQERILQAADPAAANLVKWMNNKKVDMRLRGLLHG